MMRNMSLTKHYVLLLSALLLVGCSHEDATQASLQSETGTDDNNSSPTGNEEIYLIDRSYYKIVNNKTAYIPPQCYTKVTDGTEEFNPCYSCHTDSKAPNFVNDSDVQASYLLNSFATKNHWINLFKDRSTEITDINNSLIESYIRASNYFDDKGQIILAQKLQNLPKEWDIYPDGKWNGYVPDCYYNFDTEGFDRKDNGDYTLWRSFGYHPFLGTFWPTNGSTDDVLIRLPKYFSEDINGTFNIEVYKTNLAIVETIIKEKSVDFPIDERRFDVDADRDGSITISDHISKFEQNDQIFFVGKAGYMLQNRQILIEKGLYPLDTEFLHSVRYIDFDPNNGEVRLSKRMKELRYAKKTRWANSELHQIFADVEADEKIFYPDAIKQFDGHSEVGLNNKLGWTYMAYIEDSSGDLRPQNYEELLSCMGCHGMIGGTKDTIFSFGRKLDENSFQKGWFHWTQKGLKGIAERLREDGNYEYSYYLKHNKAGDEFRENDEVISKFFTSDLSEKESAFDTLHNDISYLLIPSASRAMQLNKAYYSIVKEQSYIYGRDANSKPVQNVHKTVEQNAETGITSILTYW